MAHACGMAFMDEYIARIKADIAQSRRQLAEFESGGIRIGRRGPGESTYTDITPQEIEHLRKSIAIYEGILARHPDEAKR